MLFYCSFPLNIHENKNAWLTVKRREQIANSLIEKEKKRKSSYSALKHFATMIKAHKNFDLINISADL
jgi:hypothetical protein